MGHRQRGPLVNRRDEDLERASAGLGHIDVWVFLVADEGIDAGNHVVRKVGVKVEGRHDRHARTDHFADRLNQKGFAIVVVLQRHRSVENEEDAVDRQRGANPGHDLVTQGVERLARDATSRHDRAVGRRNQLHTEPLRFSDGAPIDGTGAFQIEQLLSTDDGAEARTLKIGERRQLPLEGIGLLSDAARDDAHFASWFQIKRLLPAPRRYPHDSRDPARSAVGGPAPRLLPRIWPPRAANVPP